MAIAGRPSFASPWGDAVHRMASASYNDLDRGFQSVSRRGAVPPPRRSAVVCLRPTTAISASTTTYSTVDERCSRARRLMRRMQDRKDELMGMAGRRNPKSAPGPMPRSGQILEGSVPRGAEPSRMCRLQRSLLSVSQDPTPACASAVGCRFVGLWQLHALRRTPAPALDRRRGWFRSPHGQLPKTPERRGLRLQQCRVASQRAARWRRAQKAK